MPQKKSTIKAKGKAATPSSSKTKKLQKEPTKTKDSTKTIHQAIEEAERLVEEYPKPKKSKFKETPKESSSKSDQTTESSDGEESEEFTFKPDLWNPFFKKDEPIRMVCIGQSNSGKSYFVKAMLTNYLLDGGPNGHYNYVIIISESIDERKEYAEIAEGFGLPVISRDKWPLGLYDDLKNDFVKRTEEGKQPLNVLLIVDDFGSNEFVQGGSKTIADEFTKCGTLGRHSMISMIVLIQSPRMISQTSKGQSSLICFTKLATAQQREVVLKQVLSGMVDLPTQTTAAQEMKFYKEVMREYAHDQGDMLICEFRPKDSRGNKGKQNLFRYRALPKSMWKKPLIENDETEE